MKCICSYNVSDGYTIVGFAFCPKVFATGGNSNRTKGKNKKYEIFHKTKIT